MTNTNHNHTANFHLVLDDVNEDRVVAVAKASVEPLVGEVEITATGPGRTRRDWRVRFYGLNENEAYRTMKVLRGAIQPLVGGLGPMGVVTD